MRFLLNFFFFGITFYLIWMFFPDAFLTLVNWANHVVEFFRELLYWIIPQNSKSNPNNPYS